VILMKQGNRSTRHFARNTDAVVASHDRRKFWKVGRCYVQCLMVRVGTVWLVSAPTRPGRGTVDSCRSAKSRAPSASAERHRPAPCQRLVTTDPLLTVENEPPPQTMRSDDRGKSSRGVAAPLPSGHRPWPLRLLVGWLPCDCVGGLALVRRPTGLPNVAASSLRRIMGRPLHACRIPQPPARRRSRARTAREGRADDASTPPEWFSLDVNGDPF
jgi:hypothetical protein